MLAASEAFDLLVLAHLLQDFSDHVQADFRTLLMKLCECPGVAI